MRANDRPDLERLTPRQREILELVAKGLTNDDIGGVLGISFATVRAHMTAILATLEVTNRTEAAALFLASQASPTHIASVLERPAIAVLPLIALDDAPRTRTIAGAVARDLTSLFARSCWFPVISQLSTVTARTLGTTSQAIGTALGARFLIDGALFATDRSWRLDVQIDDSRSGHCLWTDRFDFPLEGVFEVLADICQRVVGQAYPVLIRHVQADLVQGRKGHEAEAWELTHQAMDLCAQRSLGSNAAAREGFDQAIARDPTLVLAHFGKGLAAYDAVLCQWGDADLARDRLAAAAGRCIELAPHQGEGYFLQARYYQATGDHARVVAPLELAIAHNPSFAQAHALLAQALHIAGRPDESMARMRHALRLGPRGFVAGLAMLHYMRGEYPEALAAAEDAISLSPSYTFARVIAAVSAHAIGDRPRAVEHERRLRRDYPPFTPDSFRTRFGPEAEVVRIATALAAITES